MSGQERNREGEAQGERGRKASGKRDEKRERYGGEGVTERRERDELVMYFTWFASSLLNPCSCLEEV